MNLSDIPQGPKKPQCPECGAYGLFSVFPVYFPPGPPREDVKRVLVGSILHCLNCGYILNTDVINIYGADGDE